jgi:hypothetical protein
MAMPPIPGVIREVAPAARLLTIVREPVERYRSGFKQWQEQARRRSLRRNDRVGKREALMRGFYGRQVQRLLEVVPREQLLVLQYEQCVRAPGEEFARTLRFLGVSPYQPDERMLTMRYNQTLGDKGALTARDEAALVAEYEPEVALLKELVPDIDLSLWPRFGHLERGR